VSLQLCAAGDPPRGGLGIELGRGPEGVLVVWTGQAIAAKSWTRAPLWLDAGDPLLRAASKSHPAEPRAARRALALALRAGLAEAPAPERVAEAIDAGLAPKA
jgi:hypothetical protein